MAAPSVLETSMTALRFACGILTLILIQSAATAADNLPRRKSGLWEMKMSMAGMKTPMNAMQTCIDQASDDLMQSNAQRATSKNCTRSDVKRDGDRVLIHSECTMDKMKTVSDAVFSGNFDSGYRGDITTHYDPPVAGREQMQMTIEARWLGPCKPGQKGGDIMINGMTVNANQMGKPAN
jgi:hypothetical protein